MLKFILLIFYVILSISGLSLIKIFLDNSTLDINTIFSQIVNPYFLTGITLYGAGFLIWIIILKFMPLSTAFPLASGILIVGTQISGFFLLHEQVNLRHITGLLLLIAGIAVLYINFEGSNAG